MKKINVILVMCCIFIIMPIYVSAHPGRTDSSGCHVCKTNCASWGLNNGEYHCHNGNTYSNSRGQIFNKNGSLVSNGSSSSFNNSSTNNSSSTSNKPVYIKSSNANLGVLKIDGENINISDTMNFITTNVTPNIEGIPEHSKATLKINKPNELSRHLLNEIPITVVAEDSTVKNYKLIISLVSDDATIQNLKINEKEIEINDKMSFTTTDSKIEINAITSDIKAKIISDNKYNLEIGENKISIKVLAEDGKTEKEYMLNVKREKILSNNVGINVFVNGEKVVFNNYESEMVYISSNIDKIDIKYELDDENAHTNLKYNKNLKSGDKRIVFKVVSESGKEQKYIINIHKYSKSEDIIYTVIGFAFIGGIIFGIYKIFKKFKKNKKIDFISNIL